MLLIEGEAGSGKTTLLAEAMRLAKGFSVFQARAHEIDRDRPFGLLSDALAIGRSSGVPEKRSIYEGLRVRSGGQFDDALRYRLVEDFLALLERDALSGPVLVALDDLHWADDPSILVVHHLARRLASLPICLAVTRRPPDIRWGPDRLEELARNPQSDRIQLDALGEEDVALLASRILGVAPAAGLRALLSRAGGNPFFVTELLAALREDHSIDIEGTRADVSSMVDLEPQLRMVVLSRLSGLSPQTVAALRMAAVLGTTFSATDLAVALGADPTVLVASLDEAMAAGVLRAEDDRLSFRHDLVRSALYGDVPTSIRNALHLQVGLALLKAGAAPAHAAPHFAAGAEFGDDGAVSCLRQAAGDIASTEPKLAARWLTRALELVSETDERHDSIVLDACAVHLRVGDAATAESLAREALARPQPSRRRAELHRLLASAVDAQERCLEAAAFSELEASAGDLDQAQRVRFAAQAVEFRVHVAPVVAEGLAKEVLERARAIGDEEAIRWVLAALYHVATWSGDYHEALRVAQEYESYLPPGERVTASGGMVGRALARIGRTREALDALRAEVAAREARRDLRQVSLVLLEIAGLEMSGGRWDEAVSNAEAALDLAIEFRQPIRHDEAAALLALLTCRRGDFERAALLLGSLHGRRQWVAAPAQARLAEATGQPQLALQIMRDAWRIAEAAARRGDMVRYTPELIRLERAAGEIARARVAVDAADDIARASRVEWMEITALRCRGLLGSDADLLVAAADRALSAGRLDDRASALAEAGSVLLAADRRPAAVPLLEEAVGYADSVGAIDDRRRIEADLRVAGVRRGRRGPRSHAKSGWESLSETERRVVRLAAEGLTNAEIGRQLYISGRTVERHLTHVYTKLSISSRVELAARAATERLRS